MAVHKSCSANSFFGNFKEFPGDHLGWAGIESDIFLKRFSEIYQKLSEAIFSKLYGQLFFFC